MDTATVELNLHAVTLIVGLWAIAIAILTHAIVSLIQGGLMSAASDALTAAINKLNSDISAAPPPVTGVPEATVQAAADAVTAADAAFNTKFNPAPPAPTS
jgi:hypothetical protein